MTKESKSQVKVLDLFCGQGGCSVGYFNAGFDVVGVDVLENKAYPFEYIQKSVFDLDIEWMKGEDALHNAIPPKYMEYIGKQFLKPKVTLEVYN